MRLLIVLPSWVGDAVMATPALRRLRSALPGAFLGGLLRPGLDEVLAGLDLLDEVHVERSSGVMGPKHVAARVRPRRYDAALLLTNSFSTALITRLAAIPRRVGYARDGRSMLLTHALEAPRRASGGWAPVPAVAYYAHAAECFLALLQGAAPPAAPWPARWAGEPIPIPPAARLELAITPEQARAAADILSRAGLADGTPFAVLNPGGNNPAKRWPADRFATISQHLDREHGLRSLVNASPGEAEISHAIAALAPVTELCELGVTLGALKGIIRAARLLVTNDTGPRHFAAALAVPTVTLFGPTDPRWTTIPAPAGERLLAADPSLPPALVADDHPDRCRIERIEVPDVARACDALLV